MNFVRRVTLTDSLERAVKKSNSSACLAFACAAVLPMQISGDAREPMAKMCETAVHLANDVSQPIALRAQVGFLDCEVKSVGDMYWYSIQVVGFLW